ncbi:MAG: hypothetical protein K2X39_00735 [Silvanigrellaceae bacterium]|nr:hypothetical protein [Silvanigrellaceae bacterium]
MYLSTASIALDLEPEVPSFNRERILRTLKERLKKQFHGRIIVRANKSGNGLMVAFFCDKFAKISPLMDEVFDKLESAGEARILSHKHQIFSWFEERFIETRDEILDETTKNFDCLQKKQPSTDETHFLKLKASNKTIVYDHDDDYPKMETMPRFSRKHIRIPTRK